MTYPITIFEEIDLATNIGWRLTIPSEVQAILHVSIHEQDMRYTTNPQLKSTTLWTNNFAATRIWQEPSALRGINRGQYERAGSNYVVDALVPGDAQLFSIVRRYLDEGGIWLNGAPHTYCDDCGKSEILHTVWDTHQECVACGELSPESQMEPYKVIYGYQQENAYFLCYDCARSGGALTDYIEAFPCPHCERYIGENSDYHRRITYLDGSTENMCEPCLDSLDLSYCEGCDRWGHYDEFVDDDYGDPFCEACAGGSAGAYIQAWNYTPALMFHPKLPTDPFKPLYIGMELEMTWQGWQHNENAAIWLRALTEDYGNLLYVKHDSSVSDGFEVVTHPMEPAWARDHFPFHFFGDAIADGASETHDSTGTHIHIDRGALTTAQMWKLMQVHYKLESFCGKVGGRGTNASYASWNKSKDIAIANMMKISREKGKAFGDMDRYVPVNLQNEQTIELRYMKGGIHPDQINKNIQWVQALYEFTDSISVHDVKAGVVTDERYILGWILDRDELYPQLAEHLKKQYILPAKMPEMSV